MPRSRVAPRGAFNLVQLLIVLVFLLLLLGLLLAAVSKVQRSAGRLEDANKLKQVCLATVNCADTNAGKLPPLAGPFPADRADAPFNGLGTVFFHILPYIEQDTLYKSSFRDMQYRGDTPGVRDVVIKVYLSSADKSATDPLQDGWLARSNVAANFQVFGDPGKNSLAGRSRYPASIADGTSNTIFFAHRYQLCDSDPCAWAYEVGTAWAPAFAYLSKGKFQTLPAPLACDSSLAQGLEANGINVGLGDCSVRFVSKSVSPQTWWSACTPAGGEVLESDW